MSERSFDVALGVNREGAEGEGKEVRAGRREGVIRRSREQREGVD
jgi:hypothetical protein